MLLLDYVLEVFGDTIIMDKEMTPHIGAKNGDQYVVSIVDGQIFLRKMKEPNGYCSTNQ